MPQETSPGSSTIGANARAPRLGPLQPRANAKRTQDRPAISTRSDLAAPSGISRNEPTTKRTTAPTRRTRTRNYRTNGHRTNRALPLLASIGRKSDTRALTKPTTALTPRPACTRNHKTRPFPPRRSCAQRSHEYFEFCVTLNASPEKSMVSLHPTLAASAILRHRRVFPTPHNPPGVH